MRFEDERYIRVYTRDSMTMLMLTWEARAVLWETFRKVDRAGIIDLGEDGIDGLAAMIRIPSPVVRSALEELTKRKVLELRADGLLVAPRFVEAQEAKASDKARQKAARERARDAARAVDAGLPAPAADSTDKVTSRDEPVTSRDGADTSRDETSRKTDPRHADSIPVTLSRTTPSRAVPEEHSQSEHSEPPAKPSAKRTKGTRLLEDWEPSPEQIAKLRHEFKVDPTPSVRRFKNYWLNATRNAVKPRWDLAFDNWVERDAADGKLPKAGAEPEAETELPLVRAEGRDDPRNWPNPEDGDLFGAAQSILGVNLRGAGQ